MVSTAVSNPEIQSNLPDRDLIAQLSTQRAAGSGKSILVPAILPVINACSRSASGQLGIVLAPSGFPETELKPACMNMLKELVPKQKKGLNTGATSKVVASSRHSAILLFNEAKNRLFDINNWYNTCGRTGAEFRLTDAEGRPLESSQPETGHLIRINLPAPPNPSGDGFDWVRIEKIIQSRNLISDEELIGFRVRPAKNPENRSEGNAHFYTSDATSSFLVYRKAFTVYAMERGRNELPNSSGSLMNKLRNILVAVSAMLGLSKPQWKRLTEGLLHSNNVA